MNRTRLIRKKIIYVPVVVNCAAQNRKDREVILLEKKAKGDYYKGEKDNN